MLTFVVLISFILSLYQLIGDPSGFKTFSHYFCFFVSLYFLFMFPLSILTEILTRFSKKFEYINDLVDELNRLFQNDICMSEIFSYCFAFLYPIFFGISLEEIFGFDLITFTYIPLASLGILIVGGIVLYFIEMFLTITNRF